MDLERIGKFIAERRKSKKMTQAKLAEQIRVSEKTISKWECGKGFPDVSLILSLCQVLGISANELLSGMILSDEEYKKNAEEHLINLKNQQEKAHKNLLAIEWVVGGLSIIYLIVMCCIVSYCEMAIAWKVVLLLIGFVNTFVAITVCLLIERNAGYYECKHCKHKYIPTYKSIVFAMHLGRTRYLKCPKCGKRGWNKKVINQD